MRVVVVNHAHTTVCGIHDLGCRIARRLDGAADRVGYIEASSVANIPRADVTLFNYRQDLMPWVADALPHLYGASAAILHNYDLETVDQRAAELLGEGFDRVVVLDPDVVPTDPRVIAVGRFLPPAATALRSNDGQLRVGSFGFAFPHKRFDLVAEAVAALPLPNVIYRLHTPEAFFNGAGGAPLYAPGIYDACTRFLPAKQIEHTTDHRSDAELVDWLAGNHVNCLFYEPGQPDAGLSSALDYLLAARRPILVSDAAMFRHGGTAVVRWPRYSLFNVIQRMHAAARLVEQVADHYDDTSAVDLLKALTP